MLGGTDFTYKPKSGEEILRTNISPRLSQEEIRNTMYIESAKRVVMTNCLVGAGFDIEKMHYFGKEFYEQKERQAKAALQCYNERMLLHFGETGFKKNVLSMTWDEMHSGWERLKEINPQYRYKK